MKMKITKKKKKTLKVWISKTTKNRCEHQKQEKKEKR